MYDPGYEREDTTVSVETNVYATSKPDGDLVWTGVSESFNPKSAKKVADGLVREVPKQMEKDGLLPKKSPRSKDIFPKIAHSPAVSRALLVLTVSTFHSG